MSSNAMPEAYVAGVEMAKEREDAFYKRRNKRLRDFALATNTKALASSLKEAKERAERRKARYPEEPRMVKFIAVPRGSKPLLALEIDEAFVAAPPRPDDNQTSVDDETDDAIESRMNGSDNYDVVEEGEQA